MTIATLLAFNAALIAALLSPGPAMLVALRQSVAHGLGAGVATGLGLATMASLWTLAALMGLDAFFRVFPFAYGALKIAGAIYLLFIAWRTWVHAKTPLGEVEMPRGAAFRRGFLVNLGNPKSVLFAAAVLVVIFPPEMSFGAKLLIGANQFLLEAVAYGALAWLATRRAVARPIIAAKAVFDRITAAVLGAFGLSLLLDR